MSHRLRSLIKRVEGFDAALADDLLGEFEKVASRRKFGLNFERHVPEAIALPGRRIGIGDKVRLIPPRGETVAGSSATWIVTNLKGPKRKPVAELIDPRTDEEATRAVDDLVFVADFRDPIYPGLTSTERINEGGGAPSHVVINSENFHALKAMLFTFQAAVDVIYIDPPYNTGGKTSWLYNDNYVDSENAYKHSKWLAFMERRLKLARKMLRDSGVIFVSIDDAEQHRLRMLLDQVFGEDNFVDTLAVEMSTTSGPKTVNAQQGTIVKNVEYVHIYRRSAAFDLVKHTPLFDAVDGWDANYKLWLDEDGSLTSLEQAMLRDDAVRSELERFDLVDEKGKFRSAMLEPLLTMSPVINEFILDNRHRIARMDRLPVSCEASDPPVGQYIEFATPGRTYLVTRLESGRRWQVIPLARNYRMSDDYKPRFGRTVIRGDLWKGFHSDMAHVGNEGQINFNNGKKPVRLIKQLVRWANNKPDALIVDFFGGSGTTAHAVMEMNAEDDGRRRAVVITNNEINERTRNSLRKRGLRQGDTAWEAEGVYEAVTKPRLRNVATAERTAANVEFFDLTHLNPALIELDLAFEAIAPLLWMRAGSEGRCIAQRSDTYELADTYAVLFDIDASREFIAAVSKAGDIGSTFVITDDETQYQAVVGQLPEGVKSVQLYEAYLQTFRRNPGGV